jgi:1,4-dihydroxy-2-naphthoate octaprenyltransferase
MFGESRLPKLKRFTCGVIGVVAIALGVHYSRAAYAFSYTNRFGGLVFGPIVAVLGTVALLGAVYNWPKVWDSPPRDTAQKKRR